MTVTTFWLSLGILTLVFLIMLLIFYTLYRREIKVKTESTAKVLGEVVAFDSKNQYIILGRNPQNLMTTRENLFELNTIQKDEMTIFKLKEYL